MGEFALNPYQVGFLYGVLFAVGLGVFLMQFGIWRKSLSALFKPQSVSQKTSKTPSQVFWSAMKALFWMLVMLAAAVGAAYVLFLQSR